MIARIVIPLLLLILLPDFYIDRFQLRHKPSYARHWRLLWWLPGVGMTVFTIVLSLTRNFLPSDIAWIELYLFLLGLFVVPKAVYTFCSFMGHWVRVWCHGRHNWGNRIGFPVALFFVALWVYSITIGPRQLCVKHVDLYFSDLPKAYDGYRIAHISDLHVGSFSRGSRQILVRDIDSINALRPDLIAFTGDLENMQPSEVKPLMPVLSRMTARDGVCSVLGNHDYSQYVRADSLTKRANEQELISLQRAMGWQLLMNEHIILRRGADSLVVAGMENDGTPPFPNHADMGKALSRVSNTAFTVMLQHDPSAWRRDILPKSRVQLTLSGHTHGGQVSILGLRLTHLRVKEDRGLYQEGRRCLYVNPGLGGAVMFRLGVTPEITLITLHRR